MRLFLDANVVISVLNKEYPLFNSSARILSLATHKNFDIYISPLSLAIAYYFASKKCGGQKAKQKINTLLNYVKVTNIDNELTLCAIRNKAINDFEDGMQYYSALDSACELIVTEDQHDFYFSDIETCNCEGFISTYGERFAGQY